MFDQLSFALGVGFLLGLRHAFEADHLVAVTTIVSEQRSLLRSSLVGVLWGVGHTASIAAVGVVIILLRVTIPPGVGAALELCVAGVIVLLGARLLYLSARARRRAHAHTHTHGGSTHTHFHVHDGRDEHAPSAPHATEEAGHVLRGWRPVAVGMVHGLAGAAALPLLVLAELARDRQSALGFAYLLVFGLGSIVGMLLMSTLISLPFLFTAARFERAAARLRLAAGLASVVFGGAMAFEIVQGFL